MNPWLWRAASRTAEESVADAGGGPTRAYGPKGAAPITPPAWSFSSIPGPSRDLLFAREGRHSPVTDPGVEASSADTRVTFRLLALFGFIGVVTVFLLVAVAFARNLTQEARASAAPPAAIQPTEIQTVTALRMGPVSTGIIAVDNALRAFLEGDADQAASNLVLEKVECGAVPWGGAPPLACGAEEATGSRHELVLAGCERAWISREVARAELGTLLVTRPGLLSVAKANGAYRAILSWPNASDQTLALMISAAGVTSYASGCGPATVVGAK